MRKERLFIYVIAAALLIPSAAAAQIKESIGIHEYALRKADETGQSEYRQLAALTDTSLLNRKMDSSQMSDYIKATAFQTRMVYLYSSVAEGRNNGMMTPLEFVHSLTEDLFRRKALQVFVSRKQKEGLIVHQEIMDAAAQGRVMTSPQLDSLVQEYITKTADCRKESEYPD